MADAPPRRWPALDLDVRRPDDAGEDLDTDIALALDGVGALAVEADAGVHWRVYFGDTASRDAAARALEAAVGGAVTVAALEVPDEGWAHKVQSTLTAIRIGDIVVAPPWDVPADTGGPERPGSTTGPGATLVVIEPSTGFGTGHHQSTRLCLRLIQQMPLEGRHVVDVGTGSGVLAIAAALRGARVVAVDNDEDAVAAACANARRNGVTDRVRVEVADLAGDPIPPGDVVFANLTPLVLRAHRAELRALVVPGGSLVASGFNADQVRLVRDTFGEFDLHAREDEDDWSVLWFRRPQPVR